MAALAESLRAPAMVSLDDASAAAISSAPADPTEAIDRNRRLTSITAALGSLPEREQRVVHMYYGRGMKLKEIGVELGVGESRVCQLRSLAVTNLRAAVLDQAPPSNDQQAPPPGAPRVAVGI